MDVPFIPQRWKNGTLVLIPKPNRPTHTASLLRPLALMDPIGKAVIGLLTHKAMDTSWQVIAEWPQFSYLRARSAFDAINRVCTHAKAVRQQVQT